MLKVTVTFTRPSKNVEWYKPDAADIAYYDSKVASADFPARVDEVSADGLVWKMHFDFESKTKHNAFLADTTMLGLKEKRLLYCVANGITIDYAGELINDAHDPA